MTCRRVTLGSDSVSARWISKQWHSVNTWYYLPILSIITPNPLLKVFIARYSTQYSIVTLALLNLREDVINFRHKCCSWLSTLRFNCLDLIHHRIARMNGTNQASCVTLLFALTSHWQAFMSVVCTSLRNDYVITWPRNTDICLSNVSSLKSGSTYKWSQAKGKNRDDRTTVIFSRIANVHSKTNYWKSNVWWSSKNRCHEIGLQQFD